MGHNGIGPKGAAKLAAALSYNTTLELLNLTNNHLGEARSRLAPVCMLCSKLLTRG